MIKPIEFIGEPLGGDVATSRIATAFPSERVIVTLPGVHATQQLAYVDRLNARRAAGGQPPLGADEEVQACASAVDLIVKDGLILIRPNPAAMDLAFAADEMLQECTSKRKIRFLYAYDSQVQQALRARGENWRMAGRPRAPHEIDRLIAGAKIGIGGRPIYYYSPVTGTRWLTLQEFEGLAALDPDGLGLHLREIGEHSKRHNRQGYREVSFFGAGERFSCEDVAVWPGGDEAPEVLRARHRELAERFREAVPPELRRDDVKDPAWRKQMLLDLVRDEDTVLEEVLEGIGAEFFMQILWLPGGRVEQGDLIFDPVFEEPEPAGEDEDEEPPADPRVKGFICNYLREFGDLEYVNVGVLSSTMSRRARAGGHRAYIAEFKHAGEPKPGVRVIRMQKWGIHEHLDARKDLLRAIMESEEYTEYILDRRLGCRQLGMPVPPRMILRRLWEPYFGTNEKFHKSRIWTTYFERDYIPGIATDKIPDARLRDERFALKLARLLGRAAAPNMIVGRSTIDRRVLFDDGDEVIVLDGAGMPGNLVVADHTGTFGDYESPLATVAPAYAEPVLSRVARLANPGPFAAAYLTALIERLTQIQEDYRKRRRAFDRLFDQAPKGEGSFSDRWKRVLARLDEADVERIRACIAERLPV